MSFREWWQRWVQIRGLPGHLFWQCQGRFWQPPDQWRIRQNWPTQKLPKKGPFLKIARPVENKADLAYRNFQKKSKKGVIFTTMPGPEGFFTTIPGPRGHFHYHSRPRGQKRPKKGLFSGPWVLGSIFEEPQKGEKGGSKVGLWRGGGQNWRFLDRLWWPFWSAMMIIDGRYRFHWSLRMRVIIDDDYDRLWWPFLIDYDDLFWSL